MAGAVRDSKSPSIASMHATVILDMLSESPSAPTVSSKRAARLTRSAALSRDAKRAAALRRGTDA